MQTKENTCANSVDLNETAWIRICIVCQAIFDFWIAPLFVQLFKFNDGRVQFRNIKGEIAEESEDSFVDHYN